MAEEKGCALHKTLRMIAEKAWRGLSLQIPWMYLLILLVGAGICSFIFYPKIENFFVFYPDRSMDVSPERMCLPYRDVYFPAKDGTRLHGWFFPGEKGAPVIVYCHGNAGNISHRIEIAARLLEQGLQVFLFDYRGYGRSSGSPSEEGIYKDGLGAWEYVVESEKIPPDGVIAYGHSLGAAVAIEIALGKQVRSLIIESAFTSTKDMAKTMPLFALFSPLLPAHFHNLEKVGRVRVPKLIMHGDLDEIIPFHMGKTLYEAAAEPRFFLPIRGAMHNDTYVVGGEKYFRTLAAFARDSKI